MDSSLQSPPPKKKQRLSSAGMVMASILWDPKVILLIDYLEKSHKLMSEYYACLLVKLVEKNY